MATYAPLTAQLVADLFLAIDAEDPAATFAAARALAGRIGEPAAVALARGLLADRRGPHHTETSAPIAERLGLIVACA